MLPVAIFRFSPTEGPAFLGDWLHEERIATELIAIDAGATLPADPRRYAGIVMMGGPMSVNDALPWIEPLCRLLRDAIDARVPVLGHCLGGQLLARATGAAVTRSAHPEIGWSDVRSEGEPGRAWFGGRDVFTTFQWHYETFDLPHGATRILTNAANPNQAYVLDERHVGLQCHVEMTSALVESWCAAAAEELPATTHDARQSAAEIGRDLETRIDTLQAVGRSLYARWAQNLARTRAG